MTTQKMIADWFRRGKSEEKADYMIVVCDTFDHEDYPVYTSTEGFWKEYDEHDDKNLQRIMEVYNLKKPMQEQLDTYRAFNPPPRQILVGTAPPLELTKDNERLRDLVRYMRVELFDAGLITEEEYAALVIDSDNGKRVARVGTSGTGPGGNRKRKSKSMLGGPGA